MDVETYTDFLLLQCASTFNWDVLCQRCNEISELLSASSHQLNVSHRQRRRVSDAIQQLSQQDQYGNNCLHAACYNRPPLRVITNILQCAATAKLQLHKVLTLDRSTPLGIACATGASVDVIKILLDPPSGLEHGGSLVTIPDSRGCTPLTELVSHYELLRKTPWSSGTVRSLEHVHLDSSDENRNVETVASTTAVAASEAVWNDDVPFQTFWEKVELLVKAAWFDANHQSNFNFPGSWISILHGASFVAESCPPELTLLISRSFPNMASEANRQGLLPLHLAILSGRPTIARHDQQPMNSVASRSLQQRRALWIKSLLELYPEGATVPLQDGRGILCEAIASGLLWQIPHKRVGYLRGVDIRDDDDDAAAGPLQYIWRAFPEVLAQKDRQTGLYPFLLAAQPSGDRSSKRADSSKNVVQNHVESDDEDANQLNTVFGLLRVHPQLLNQPFAVCNGDQPVNVNGR